MFPMTAVRTVSSRRTINNLQLTINMENVKTMPFGKKVRCGNFFVLKRTKSLGKSELKMLRDDMGIPADVQKRLSRSGLPYIRVEAVSGIWAVEYCCNTQMYMVIDQMLPLAVDADFRGESVQTGVADFAHLFAMMMADTMVVGDGEYQKDKALAMKGLIERQKPAEVSVEDDREILDGLRADEEARAAMSDMAAHINDVGEGGSE